jgi:hypothetical protein
LCVAAAAGIAPETGAALAAAPARFSSQALSVAGKMPCGNALLHGAQRGAGDYEARFSMAARPGATNPALR